MISVSAVFSYIRASFTQREAFIISKSEYYTVVIILSIIESLHRPILKIQLPAFPRKSTPQLVSISGRIKPLMQQESQYLDRLCVL